MYLTYYGLREEPFRLTPDGRFFHLAPPHRDALITLLKGVIHRRGFVLATGAVGTGKTLLLHITLRLLTQKFFPGKKLASALLVNPSLSRDEFLEMLLDEFEVSCPATATKPRRLLALQELFLKMQQQGGTSLIMIDEAHLLSAEMLEEVRLLNNFETYREKLVQIVLVGQPELETLLQDPRAAAVRQRIASRCKLRPLSEVETRAYIAERLHVAGLRNGSPFAAPALEAVHHYAQGIPRVINLICDTSLLLACENQRKSIEPDVVEDAAVSLGLPRPATSSAVRTMSRA